ncbi:MAG: DUF1508 domain-containing protein [Clostridia bacterium]|nr:DUF1508 domain-containing protein [Clostridia bacterium]
MELIKKCIDYLKANPVMAIIIAAALVFIIVLVVIICALSAKARRAKKRIAKAESKAKTDAQAAVDQKQKAEKEAAEKEAARKATLERLEAERLQAEKEEAEARAKAEEERRIAEQAAAEQKAKEAAAKKAKEEAERLEKAKLAAEERIKKEAEAEAKAKAAAEAAAKAKAEAEAAAKAAAKAKEEAKARAEALAKIQEEKNQAKEAHEKAILDRLEQEDEKLRKQAEKRNAVEQAATDASLYDEFADAPEQPDWEDEGEIEKIARYTGKWTICRMVTDEEDAENMYFFELHASNGEKLLSSEEYTSYEGAIRGIQTHKANIEKGNFKITLSKKGDYIFKLLSGKNMLLCMGENYPTKARCESAIESTKKFAARAILDENVQDVLVKTPIEDEADILPIKENGNGKWIVDCREGINGEKLYFFELFANNGEKLLSSEDYTSHIGAIKGIQTHKANIEKDNFRISLTKRGDYIYKLLNANGQLLCLGEHYRTKRLCQNAVESVKRFALTSPILTDKEHMQ